MKILVIAFAGTVAEQTAMYLQSDRTVLLASSEQACRSYITNTNFAHYDFILGLGAYSGKDADALRIETECTSRFKNAGDTRERTAIPYFLRPAPGIKLARGIGNSWCNLVSYTLLSTQPDSLYCFVHIPKGFSPQHAADILTQQLAQLRAV